MILLPLLATTSIEATEAQSGSSFAPLELWHYPSQIFWTLLLFAVLYFVLSRLVLPKLGNTIETRQSHIASDLDEAQRYSDRADQAQKDLEKRMGEARNTARETANAARAEIESQIGAETARVDATLNEKLEAAETRISELRASAMSNVAEIAKETTQAMTSRLSIDVSADDAVKAVNDTLN